MSIAHIVIGFVHEWREAAAFVVLALIFAPPVWLMTSAVLQVRTNRRMDRRYAEILRIPPAREYTSGERKQHVRRY